MTDKLRPSIPLDEQQITRLRQITDNGSKNYREGYKFIESTLRGTAADRDGTTFWFREAAGINSDSSLSSEFIRRNTRNGLHRAGVPLDQRLDMQVLSDLIAYRVLNDVIEKKAVPPLAEIVNKDIAVALGAGHMKLAGWGGSFYYWDLPFSNDPDARNFPKKADGSYWTVGDEIIRRGELEFFKDNTVETIKELQQTGKFSRHDIGQILETIRDSDMPRSVQAEITVRVGWGVIKDGVRETVEGVERDVRCTIGVPNCQFLQLDESHPDRRNFERIHEMFEKSDLNDIERTNLAAALSAKVAETPLMKRVDTVVMGELLANGMRNAFVLYSPHGPVGPHHHVAVDIQAGVATPPEQSFAHAMGQRQMQQLLAAADMSQQQSRAGPVLAP